MGWSLPAPGAHSLRASGVGLWLSSSPGPLLEGGHKAPVMGSQKGARLPPNGDSRCT